MTMNELRRSAANLLLRAEPLYALALRLRGGQRQPLKLQAPAPNRLLQSEAEVGRAIETLRANGLILHPHRPKNWDSLIALDLIVKQTTPADAILDAGGLPSSNVLPNLFLHGYRRLEAGNLVFTRPFQRGPVRFRPMDITRTDYQDGTFGAIFCQSVIEHGVPLDRFFSEMARIMRPGAVLVVSTDFWPDKLTVTRQAYGAPICIFSRAEMEAAIATAAGCGLHLTSPVDWQASERPVYWQAADASYTFLCLAFQRGPA